MPWGRDFGPGYRSAIGAAVVMFYAQFGYAFQQLDEKRSLIRSVFARVQSPPVGQSFPNRVKRRLQKKSSAGVEVTEQVGGVILYVRDYNGRPR